MKKWYEHGPFTIFDTETTGLSPQTHELVEIAAVRVELDGSRSKFQSLIRPVRKMSRSVIGIHHISNEMVADAPSFRHVGPDFLDFAKDSVLVAYNARFDLSFLQESLAREGSHLWTGKTLDLLALSKQAFPEFPSYKLQYMRSRLGLGCGDELAHRAMGDVEITLELFQLTLETLMRATQ